MGQTLGRKRLRAMQIEAQQTAWRCLTGHKEDRRSPHVRHYSEAGQTTCIADPPVDAYLLDISTVRDEGDEAFV